MYRAKRRNSEPGLSMVETLTQMLTRYREFIKISQSLEELTNSQLDEYITQWYSLQKAESALNKFEDLGDNARSHIDEIEESETTSLGIREK